MSTIPMERRDAARSEGQGPFEGEGAGEASARGLVSSGALMSARPEPSLAVARRSWRFELVAAVLVSLAALFSLGPTKAAAAEPGSAAGPSGEADPTGVGVATSAPAATGETKAKPAPVTLAEVTAHEASSTRLGDVPALVRKDAEEELSRIDWSKLSLRRRYKLSASVVRLDSARTGEKSLTASCTISAAVRDADRGTILFIVQGNARAEDVPSAVLSAERDALAAAVRGAITAVPEAMRRSL
jgi:hypothetical protein